MFTFISRLNKVLFIVIVLTVFSSGLLYSQKTEVVIGDERLTPIKGKVVISISKFSPMKESDAEAFKPKELTGILKNDLFMTGMFRIMEGSGAKEKKDVDFLKLTSKRVEFAAIATYTVKKKELILIGVLYDVGGISKIFKKRYKGKKGMHRTLVHRFAEDILKNTTGNEGITDSRITFISDKSGHKEIYVVDYDGYNIKQLTREKSIALLPRWSPDGRRIAYTSYKNKRPYLYILDTKAGLSKRLFPTTRTNIGGRWSPDGRYLVLMMTKNGNSDIYVYDEKKKDLRRLTRSWAIETSASWLPNGRKILFTSDRSGKPQVYMIDVDGTNLQRLTFDGRYNDSAVCHPEDDVIAYVSLEENKFNIYTMRLDGSGRKRLTYNNFSNENPSWAPDGSYIVFTSERRGRKGIYVMRSDGEYERLLFSLRANCEDPAWSK